MDDFREFFSNDDPQISEFNEQLKKFCEEANDFLNEHDRSVHDGDICDEERANMLAFIAFSIGWEDFEFMFKTMVDRVLYYSEHHRRHHTQGNGN